MTTRPCYIANRPFAGNADLAVTDKFAGSVIARGPLAGAAVVERAIAAAVAAEAAMAKLPSWRREAALSHVAARCEERRDELARTLCAEAGKPIRDARGEVARLIDTLRYAAGEALRIGGDVVPLDITPRAEGYRGMWKRVPVGACAFITPFNFPLNLAAHKIAPALAAGCPFVLKPATNTPLGALLLGEMLAETDLPEGAFSIVPCDNEQAERLATDPRLKLLSFTGSPAVGWMLKAKAGQKKVALELGGNAAVIVDADTDLDDAVERIVFGAFYQSGQSCISVQRVLVHDSIYERFRDRLVAKTQALRAGDPRDEATFVGPLIDARAADRVMQWLDDARQRGARVLCGGARSGNVIEPTLLEDVPVDAPLCAEEAFAPVAVLARFTDFDDALQRVDASRYGLQAGVFTRDLHKALRAWDELQVGGVIVGDVPSWRVDHMPYGGVKDSGLGREGLRYAIEEMTEIRLLVIRAR